MSSFEEQFEKATEARDIPGVVLIASDAKGISPSSTLLRKYLTHYPAGKFKYQAAFGPRTPTEKINLDTTFILASCTKLMSSIAALQCVERGLIGLDDDVSSVLTELKGRQILTGFKEGSGEPEYKKAEKIITLRSAPNMFSQRVCADL
jgi:CubicO group peptidase (beta-lactamase class C family)